MSLSIVLFFYHAVITHSTVDTVEGRHNGNVGGVLVLKPKNKCEAVSSYIRQNLPKQLQTCLKIFGKMKSVRKHCQIKHFLSLHASRRNHIHKLNASQELSVFFIAMQVASAQTFWVTNIHLMCNLLLPEFANQHMAKEKLFMDMKTLHCCC